MEEEWIQRCTSDHFKGLRRLFDSKLYSDVDVQVGDEHFRCHRVILAAASDYFDGMFTSGMTECLTGVISLHDVGVDCFERVLQYMYTSQVPLDENNALETLCAADMLQIQSLKECCEDFLTNHIKVDNCTLLFHHARLRNCTTLEMKTKDFILSNFVELSQSGETVNLDKPEFFEVLADDHLNIPNESHAFRAADEWLRAEPERMEHEQTLQLFKLIRLPQIDLDFLINEIQLQDYVKGNPDVQEMIMDAVRYHVTPAVCQGFISGNIERRLSSKQETTLTCLEINYSTYNSYCTIKAFDRQEHTWYDRAKTNLSNQSGEIYHCVIGNEYYFVDWNSGYINLYLGLENQEIKMQKPSRSAKLLGIVGVESNAYCISYEDGKTSLYKIDFKTKTWKEEHVYGAGVCSAAAAVLRNNVYLFGGTIRSGVSVPTIHCFNIQNSTGVQVGNLPMPISHARATPYGSMIYIVTFDGHIIEFSEKEGAILVASIEDFSVERLDLVVWKKIILIFAPKDRAQIFTFDPEKRKVEKENALGLEINANMTNFARFVVLKREKDEEDE